MSDLENDPFRPGLQRANIDGYDCTLTRESDGAWRFVVWDGLGAMSLAEGAADSEETAKMLAIKAARQLSGKRPDAQGEDMKVTNAELLHTLRRAQKALAGENPPAFPEWVDLDQSLRECIASLDGTLTSKDDGAYIRGLRVGRKEGGDSMKEAALEVAVKESCWLCRADTVRAMKSLGPVGGGKGY
jgi:hypothetical protein